MEGEIGREELARYLAGLTTSEEEARVLSWLERHPAMRARLEGSDAVAGSSESRRSGELLLARVNSEPVPPRNRLVDRAPRMPDRSPSAWDFFPRTRAVRGVLVVVAVIAGVLASRELFRGNDVRDRYETGPGEIVTFRLPDGSEVQLNVASRFEIPAGFDVDRRVVRLRGEAHFDVAFDPTNPFVVETGSMEVEARGTSFDVNVYDGDPLARVVVTAGKVGVRTGSEEVVLTPGHLAELRDGTLRVDSVDVDHALAWREGRLTFQAVPLVDAARRMERWYGIEVALRDPVLDSLRIDAAFDRESAEEAAHAIAAALGLGASVDTRRVIFYDPAE